MDDLIKQAISEYHPDPKSAVWKHKQSGSWIIYHKDLEVIASKAGIHFSQPREIQTDAANGIAVIWAEGRLGDKTEWSYGEATPQNTTQQYPFAMAEKRAKDRVILKLLRLHGHVYSEEEADDFATDPALKRAQEWTSRALADLEGMHRDKRAEWSKANAEALSRLLSSFPSLHEDIQLKLREE